MKHKLRLITASVAMVLLTTAHAFAQAADPAAKDPDVFWHVQIDFVITWFEFLLFAIVASNLATFLMARRIGVARKTSAILIGALTLGSLGLTPSTASAQLVKAQPAVTEATPEASKPLDTTPAPIPPAGEAPRAAAPAPKAAPAPTTKAPAPVAPQAFDLDQALGTDTDLTVRQAIYNSANYGSQLGWILFLVIVLVGMCMFFYFKFRAMSNLARDLRDTADMNRIAADKLNANSNRLEDLVNALKTTNQPDPLTPDPAGSPDRDSSSSLTRRVAPLVIVALVIGSISAWAQGSTPPAPPTATAKLASFTPKQALLGGEFDLTVNGTGLADTDHLVFWSATGDQNPARRTLYRATVNLVSHTATKVTAKVTIPTTAGDPDLLYFALVKADGTTLGQSKDTLTVWDKTQAMVIDYVDRRMKNVAGADAQARKDIKTLKDAQANFATNASVDQKITQAAATFNSRLNEELTKINDTNTKAKDALEALDAKVNVVNNRVSTVSTDAQATRAATLAVGKTVEEIAPEFKKGFFVKKQVVSPETYDAMKTALAAIR